MTVSRHSQRLATITIRIKSDGIFIVRGTPLESIEYKTFIQFDSRQECTVSLSNNQ